MPNATRAERESAIKADPDRRFWQFATRMPSGCWEWQGGLSATGYGVLSLGSRAAMRAHRMAYEIAHGPIPTGLFVCHRCDNRRCVNPEHLWLGTNSDNTRDASEKGRIANQCMYQTHCKHGHPFAGENLYITGDGTRGCRECRRRLTREGCRRYREKKRAQCRTGAGGVR